MTYEHACCTQIVENGGNPQQGRSETDKRWTSPDEVPTRSQVTIAQGRIHC